MFVGVVVENFHKCQETQEQEEKARREIKRAKKLEKKRKSTADAGVVLKSAGWYLITESGIATTTKQGWLRMNEIKQKKNFWREQWNFYGFY